MTLARMVFQRKRDGFTLIEMVVSASLMTLILVSSYLCLRAGIAGQKMVEARADVLQNGRVALELMAADLRSACPLSSNIDFLGMQRTLGGMDADNLDFGTHNFFPRRPLEWDFCRVSYFLQKDRRSPDLSLWRRRDPTPNPDPLSGGVKEPIIGGVRGLRFEYFDGYEWHENWGAEPGTAGARSLNRAGSLSSDEESAASGLPEAVRITLWLDPDPRPSARGSSAESAENPEPPIELQTATRLELADHYYQQSAFSGYATNSAGTMSPSGSGAY